MVHIVGDEHIVVDTVSHLAGQVEQWRGHDVFDLNASVKHGLESSLAIHTLFLIDVLKPDIGGA